MMIRLLCLCVSFLFFFLLFAGQSPNPASPFSPPFAIIHFLCTDLFPLCKCVAQASAIFLIFLAVFLYLLCKCLLESDDTHLRPRCLGAKGRQGSEIWKARFCPQFPQLQQQRRLLANAAFLIGGELQRQDL